MAAVKCQVRRQLLTGGRRASAYARPRSQSIASLACHLEVHGARPSIDCLLVLCNKGHHTPGRARGHQDEAPVGQ
jgi:hypothetical protein